MTIAEKITFEIAAHYARLAEEAEVILINPNDFQRLKAEIPLWVPMKIYPPIVYQGIRVVRSEDINEGEIIVK